MFACFIFFNFQFIYLNFYLLGFAMLGIKTRTSYTQVKSSSVESHPQTQSIIIIVVVVVKVWGYSQGCLDCFWPCLVVHECQVLNAECQQWCAPVCWTISPAHSMLCTRYRELAPPHRVWPQYLSPNKALSAQHGEPGWRSPGEAPVPPGHFRHQKTQSL